PIVNTCTRIFRRHAWRLVAALVSAGLVAASAVPPASADAVSDKRAQAQALSNQIDALGRKEAALGEQYNAAVLAAQSTQTKVDQQQAAVNAAQANAAKARGALQADALNAYVHGGSLVSLASRNGGAAQADGGVLAGEYVSTLASTQADNLDAFHNAAATAQIAATQLQALHKQQAAAAANTDSARSAATAAQRQVEASLGQVKGELTTLVAQAEAAKQAAAAQAAQAMLTRVQAIVSTGGGGGGNGGGASISANIAFAPVPVGVGASAAVAAAKSRLGLPYVWGAAGPGAFDCSGLIMWAWAHGGVSLPHFSGAQYSNTTHISMSQLQPGDLVFPADTGAHVAMYIGGGMIIEAPHTGDVVHIVPMYSWFVLASRP
ncbi:MAG: peptidoglycan DL-endopeptidase CwlO, partial [Acidimicrobiaceae bacterium]|nr:peptidoglycan DL-endopeptidase CwlO [Acidimicrobiaceae bacterium]